MPRIPYVNTKRADGYAVEILDRLEDRHGKVPNLHLVLAQSPAALGGLIEMERKLRAGSLDPASRHLVSLAVAAAAGSGYALALFRTQAREAGVPDRQIDELDRSGESEAFGPRERALLRFAREWLLPEGPTEGAIAGLAIHFPPAQQVEVNAAIALALFQARFARTYQIEGDGAEVAT